jgi:hypothetical protein
LITDTRKLAGKARMNADISISKQSKAIFGFLKMSKKFDTQKSEQHNI